MIRQMLQIHAQDNVAVALRDIPSGCSVRIGDRTYVSREAISRGHKMALVEIAPGAPVIKYGCVIGHATRRIAPGEHVHVHNMATNLSESCSYSYNPVACSAVHLPPQQFQGYRRGDGRAAIRNEIWILPLVGCVNSTVQTLEKASQHLVGGSLEGIYSFTHPFGCSQMSEDHARTRKLLAALVHHPNAAAVLVVSLGCENNTLDDFKREIGSWDPERVEFMVCQDADDEISQGLRLLEKLAQYAKQFQRTPIGADELVIGLKCGGSDGLSGVTANPVVGKLSDMLIAQGGSTLLTEVPEMFGAESLLLNRCRNEQVYQRAAEMLEDFKNYYVSHGQVVYENPSPGNKQGGITTLEDKSCGCVQKGGSAAIEDVLDYGDHVRCHGLSLLSAPGNDMVSTTALSAAGAHMILFTTGRGTPFGAPAPTVKIASNTQLAEKKPQWIDFNAGIVADGESIDSAAEQLMKLVLDIASGSPTRSESHGARSISIFKDGVVL